MSFWKSPIAGAVITGKPEDSFVSANRIIPDGTKALAFIKKFEYIDRFEVPFYQVTWKLADGEYKGCEVRQSIKAFDENENKRYKALNMLKLIFDLANYKPLHNNAPTNDDLQPLVNKVMGISILEWQLNGKEGNWVNEVHDSKGFESRLGTHRVIDYSYPKETSALQEFSKPKNEILDDDIPF